MTAALEAIRGELYELRTRVDLLSQAETLLTPAYEDLVPVPVEPPGPVTRKPKVKRQRRRTPTRAQVRDYVAGHEPVTRGDLLSEFGGSPKSMDSKLRRLLQDGEIEADGRPRRYRVARKPGQVLDLAAVASQTRAASSRPPDRGVYPVYDAIVDLGEASTEQLAHHAGLPRDRVVEQGRRLIQLKLVGFSGVGDRRIWRPAPGSGAA